MIVGNGLLANAFDSYRDNNSIIFFASGVSNSNETDKKNFDREKYLLINTIAKYPDKIIVYFSSCDVLYADKIDKLYYYHKREMESIIELNALKYYIFRLPQIIGYSSNSNSLLNFLIKAIEAQTRIPIWKHAVKNLIDIADVKKLVEVVIDGDIKSNQTINIINTNYYGIMEILKVIENLIGLKAVVSIEEKGFRPYYQENSILKNANMNFDDNYLKNAIKKHYHLYCDKE